MQLAALLIGSVLAAAPQPIPAPARHAAAETRAALPADVERFFAAYFAAVVAGDTDGVMDLMDTDVLIRWPGGAAVADRRQLRAALETVFGRARQEVQWRILEGAAGADWAWARVWEKSTHTPTAGGERRTFEGSHLVILRRVGGAWRLHRDYSALDAPPSTAPQRR